MVPHTIVEGPADWTSTQLQGRDAEFTYTFTKADFAELIKAVEAIKASGVASEDDVKQVRPCIALRPYAAARPDSGFWSTRLSRC